MTIFLPLAACSVLAATVLPEAEAAIASHEKMLATIETIYVRIRTSIVTEPGSIPKVMCISESWRDGARERLYRRATLTATKDGTLAPPDDSKSHIQLTGFNDREIRSVLGWDPEAPDELPLDYATHAGVFGRVKCGLGARDPTAGGSPDWDVILLDFCPGTSLPLFASTAQIVRVESDEPSFARFEIKAAKQEGFVGAVFDLDVEHGYAVRRVTLASGGVTEVEEFIEPADGVWISKRIRRSLGGVSSLVDLIECRVNQPIADSDLTVEFPEGARVDEYDKGLIHIWGTNAPRKTFARHADFMQYLYDYARKAQAARQGETPNLPIWSRPLLVANAVLLGLLLALMYIRRKLSRRRAAQ